MKKLTLFLFSIASVYAFGQHTDVGQIHGNFEAITQFYNKDDTIGAPDVEEKMLLIFWYRLRT